MSSRSQLPARRGNDARATSAALPAQRGLLERVPAILYTAEAGEHGAWHYVSPQIETILGYTPELWCADPDLWVNRLHPEDRQRVLDLESRIMVGEATATPPSTEWSTLTGA